MRPPSTFDIASIYFWELHPLSGSATVDNSSVHKSLERYKGFEPLPLGWKPRMLFR